MSFNIVVPDLGESVVEATIARWLKHEGDPVSVGEPVVVLETEKVDLEVGAEKDGVLATIQQPDGTDVKVGEVIGVIDDSAAPSQQPLRSQPSKQPTEPHSARRCSGRRSGQRRPRSPSASPPRNRSIWRRLSQASRAAHHQDRRRALHRGSASASTRPPSRLRQRQRWQRLRPPPPPRIIGLRSGLSSRAAAAPSRSAWSRRSTAPPC